MKQHKYCLLISQIDIKKIINQKQVNGIENTGKLCFFMNIFIKISSRVTYIIIIIVYIDVF